MTARVLVVDDAATVRLYHSCILSDAGFSVSEAANGYEALECALVERYDLFLVDVNMPRMDGYTLVETLRRQDATATTPIVMVSSEAEQSDADRGYAAGANLYLSKPARADELVFVARVLTGEGPG
jgi:two-component system chemotaxis response regulator CheY